MNGMTGFLTKLFAFLIAAVTLLLNVTGLGGNGDMVPNKNGSLGGVDALGREVVSSGGTNEKQVGVFYFLWLGEHGTGGPYDNTKIVANHPEAVDSEENWLAAGGGGLYEFHFWGEPLFGYYSSQDEWVFRKHAQMLTDAGVDFIVFDTTNGYPYPERVKTLIGVWYEYMAQGWDVPRLAFYTNSYSGVTMNRIYDEIYFDASLRSRYPRLDELWYRYEGKPLIIGQKDDDNLRADVRDYFRIKESQWPNTEKKNDGFPWMEFDRSLTYKAVYGRFGRREIMSVSAAQHADTCRFSATAWYGANDRGRAWHDGANDTAENAAAYGTNFAEQWEFAMAYDPDMVFVTGFNEWVAQRQPAAEGEPVVFVDCADMVNSRDVEPMNGPLGDNFYMQLVDFIAKFKGTAVKKPAGADVTVDFDGAFGQWDNPNIAVYEDYANDTVDRACSGFGRLYYHDESGRNDIKTLKAAKDSGYLYFYAETAAPLTKSYGENYMNLLLRVDPSAPNLNGYDYLIRPNRGGLADVLKYNGVSFEAAATARLVEGKTKLMLRLDRSLLGLAGKSAEIQFKWIDNCDSADVYSFYTKGDSAPYGRLNFILPV